MHFLSIDLGATSGRTVLATFDGQRIDMREFTRFSNPQLARDGHIFWDLPHLYDEILRALKQIKTEGIQLQSIGIDTWGCDFAFFDASGQLLQLPHCYRDPQTDGAMERYFADRLPQQEVYDRTGIQFMPFNSLFQLDTLRRAGNQALEHADKILFIPDALIYMLTGEAVCEYTVASTSQMLNPGTGDLDAELLQSLGLTRDRFGRLVQPGEQVGTLKPEVQEATALGAIPVVAVASHDTASAVAAVPASDAHFAYLSCGTWSLLGVESPRPIINADSFAHNFTNEGGLDHTTRFLKNITGLWIFEQCRKEWSLSVGGGFAAATPVPSASPSATPVPSASPAAPVPSAALASPVSASGPVGGVFAASPSASPFVIPSDVNALNALCLASTCQSIINPDDPRFAHPASMTAAIRAFLAESGQPLPETPADYVRIIFRSLAEKYRQVIDLLRQLTPVDIQRLHVIGGGSRNQFLMQFTADALQLPVIAGPQEGTALGNALVQLRAAGHATTLTALRAIAARSVELKTYHPSPLMRNLDWKLLKSEYLFRRPWLTARRDTCQLPNGRINDEYYVLEYPTWVHVLAITKDGEMLIIRQYRHGLGRTCFEIVAGCVEPGESPLDAAKRELAEETGYTGGEWQEVMQFTCNASAMNNITHSYVATGVERTTTQHLDATEDIEVYTFSKEEVKAMLQRGEFMQASMLAALYKFFSQL